ncbi:MAG: serine hydrolase [Pseudomonadota bacterium]|nr:serine hydrolase [Pseudomonadota bacterium]
MRTILTTVFIWLPLLATPAGAETYPDLWESRSPELQKKLEDLIERKFLAKAVARGRLALVVADITDPHKPRVASVNPDRMMYAASLPKIAILLAAFVEIEKGLIKPDDALWKDMTRMVRNSSNQAATRVLERVGRDDLLEILQSQRFQLYDPKRKGGLWVGKDYAGKGAYQRDPIHNLSHGASVMQAARFYYLLETNRLVNPELTLKMKGILSNPAINHKFVKGLKGVPGITIYRKSGTWRDYHADSALVETEDGKYIIVGLVQSENGDKWLTELARPMIELARDQ